MQLRNHKFSKDELFERQRYHKTEDQKPWPGFSRNQDFAEERGLEPIVKLSKSGDALSKVVYLTHIANGGLGTEPPAAGGYGGVGAKPPAAARFFVFFEKKSCFNAIKSHFARF